MRTTDSDIDDGEPHSEDEVLAPRLVDSLHAETPTPARRRPGSSTTAPLLLGTALAVVAIGGATVIGVALVVLLWFLR